MTTLERCPRQWQLLHARYGERIGFPPRPAVAAVEGQLVHEVLERLFRACGLAGMPAFGSSSFSDLIFEFALSKTIHQAMREREETIASHPRGGGFRFRHSANQLANEVMRLFRQQYQPRDEPPIVDRGGPKRSSPPRAPLEELRARGAIPELKLTHPSLPFVGIIDLVRATTAGVSIVDFKTGSPTTGHEQQVLAYAVLWWRITGEAPSSVEVAYPTRTVKRLVTVAMLSEAEDALHARLRGLQHTLASAPAAALAGPHCTQCHVRQFCADYWRAPAAAGEWVDLEATVAGRRALASVSIRLVTGESAELLFAPDLPMARYLATDVRVRIIGALAKGPTLYELTPAAEVFVCQ